MSDNDSPTPQRKRVHSGNGYNSDDDQRSNKRKYAADGQRMELRLLIPSRDAGTVIGKGGDNIKHLRMDYKAGVTVSDSRTPERVLIISGDIDALSDVCTEVFKGLEEKYSNDRRDFELTMKMLIHQSQAGCVIGKAGNQLKEFRHDHGVDIKVFASCCPMSTERIVQTIGKTAGVTKCVIDVCKLLKSWPPKGHSSVYDPANYDEEMVREYGGYTDDDRGGASRGGGGRDRMGGRRSPDRGGRFAGGSRDRSGFGDRGGAMGGGLGRNAAPRQTQQVSIPSDLAGVIIGKSGSRIKQIRSDSGAEVELSDEAGPGDRIITITGTPDQIQNAQYMLQMSVKQHLARNT